MVIAPEHPKLASLTSEDQRESVESYVKAARQKTDLERTELQKSKTGVFTGKNLYLLNVSPPPTLSFLELNSTCLILLMIIILCWVQMSSLLSILN